MNENNEDVRAASRSHVRVFETTNPQELDRMINDEIVGGDYVVSAVSLAVRDRQLLAVLAFAPPGLN